MFKIQYNILRSFLEESKQGNYQNGIDQYQFCCPCCAELNNGKLDGKYNLEVNFNLGKFHCWKCDIKGNISYLLKKYGNDKLLHEYLEDVKTLLSTVLYKLHAPENLQSMTSNEEIKLPKTFTKINNIEELSNKKLKEFIKSRNITQDIINKFSIGYTKWENEEPINRCRIIIPSYDKNGNLTYWSGRDFTGYDKRQKYLNVKADRKNIIFNESLIEWDGDIVLVEGIIDSLVYPNCIPLMGKLLLKDSKLYQKLMSKSNGNIYICLDNDTHIDETKRIYKMLNKDKLKDKIRYVRLDKYKDFGEIFEKEGKQGIINTLCMAKKFTDFELSFIR